jgi:hypothetical protein
MSEFYICFDFASVSMHEIFYNGIWRMDWGFDNPNKTATLIVELMIAIWGMAFIWKRGFWVALAFFLPLGACLIHTMSRGGMIALAGGLAVVILFAPRPWHKCRVATLIATVIFFSFFAFYMQALNRYSHGVFVNDKSISNRILLWQAAPIMMADAPGGWGHGCSGLAFMRWYQPISEQAEYRTLVNSHLTWLVEFGWMFRFFYFFSWSIVFGVCRPTMDKAWYAVATGIWITFGMASFFSSVAESPYLWIVPTLSFLIVVVDRARTKNYPKFTMLFLVSFIALLLCLAINITGAGRSGIRKEKERVVIGTSSPSIWLVVDEEILGKYGFAKSLRQYMSNPIFRRSSISVVNSLEDIPDALSEPTIVIISGSIGTIGIQKLSQIMVNNSGVRLILLSPQFSPSELGENIDMDGVSSVFYGEFSKSEFITTWKQTGKFHSICGIGDYIADWPSIILNCHEIQFFKADLILK